MCVFFFTVQGRATCRAVPTSADVSAPKTNRAADALLDIMATTVIKVGFQTCILFPPPPVDRIPRFVLRSRGPETLDGFSTRCFLCPAPEGKGRKINFNSPQMQTSKFCAAATSWGSERRRISSRITTCPWSFCIRPTPPAWL